MVNNKTRLNLGHKTKGLKVLFTTDVERNTCCLASFVCRYFSPELRNFIPKPPPPVNKGGVLLTDYTIDTLIKNETSDSARPPVFAH